jgi:hypothetical protein
MFNESTNLISHEEALDNINLIEDIFRDLLDQSENNGFSYMERIGISGEFWQETSFTKINKGKISKENWHTLASGKEILNRPNFYFSFLDFKESDLIEIYINKFS